MDKLKELEIRLDGLEQRVSKLEGTKPKIPLRNQLDIIGTKLKGKVDKIGQQKLILVALRFKPKQSKSDLLNVLLNWGIKNTIHKWFVGSNFKHRLLDIGLIMKDGKNSDNDDVYSLTISKGVPKTDELIEQYELS